MYFIRCSGVPRTGKMMKAKPLLIWVYVQVHPVLMQCEKQRPQAFAYLHVMVHPIPVHLGKCPLAFTQMYGYTLYKYNVNKLQVSPHRTSQKLSQLVEA